MSVSVCSISHLGGQSEFLVLLILVSCGALILPILDPQSCIAGLSLMIFYKRFTRKAHYLP